MVVRLKMEVVGPIGEAKIAVALERDKQKKPDPQGRCEIEEAFAL